MSQPQAPTAPDTAANALSRDTWSKDCVVFNGENGPIIASGNSFGPGISKVKARLCSLKFVDTTFCHALRIDIPLGLDNEDRGFGKVYQYRGLGHIDPVDYRSITLRFPVGDNKWDFEPAPPELLSRFPDRDDRKYCFVTVHLRENPTVVGYGLPFANASAPELEDWY
ncbi:uncharacterized protein ColSpa_00445 [Colletotrichum spaethianum]|uniref:Uncharacterized protein n=1 Tax=Colletotrichum spaethianum TaxID=700344 RepID=A0AA37P6Q8_9PEZI|nr:uncharacterized protein ColSpa_00445 [Colletotrichum spaethianum]GKT40264.1 hypothetical protein ColSpa_00445 [Colletotrichum spaethianum]